jgi:hypothetical protein
MVMGGVVFSGTLPSIGTRSPHLSAVGRLAIAAQSAALCGEMLCLLSGRPVQHHRHPSRSSAWFKAAQCAALELRDEEFAEVAGSE